MRKNPSNPRYTRVEVRVDPIIREVTRIEMVDQTVEVEDNRPRQNYRDNNFQRNTRGYGRQNNREEYRDNRCNEYNRGRDRSRERTYQGAIVTIEIEVPVAIDQDQDLELVLIGIE